MLVNEITALVAIRVLDAIVPPRSVLGELAGPGLAAGVINPSIAPTPEGAGSVIVAAPELRSTIRSESALDGVVGSRTSEIVVDVASKPDSVSSPDGDSFFCRGRGDGKHDQHCSRS